MEFAWKFMLPVAIIALAVVSTEKMLWVQELDGKKAWLWVFFVLNTVLTVAMVVGWSRFLGYRPERTPTRPRLVREARGYVPVSEVER